MPSHVGMAPPGLHLPLSFIILCLYLVLLKPTVVVGIFEQGALDAGACWAEFHKNIWWFHGLDKVETNNERFRAILVSSTIDNRTTDEKDSRSYAVRLTEHLTLAWDPDIQETSKDQWPVDHGYAARYTRALFGVDRASNLPRIRLSALESAAEDILIFSSMFPYNPFNYTRDTYNPAKGQIFIPYLIVSFYDERTGAGIMSTSTRWIDMASFHCPPSFCFNTHFDAILEWVSDDGTQVLGQDIIFGRFLLRKPNLGIPRLLNYLDFYENPYKSIQAINMHFRDNAQSTKARILRVYFREDKVVIAKPMPMGNDPLKYSEEKIAEISGDDIMDGDLDCYSGSVKEIQVGCIVWYDYERQVLHAMDPRGDTIFRYYLTDLTIDGARQGKPWNWIRLKPLSFRSHFRGMTHFRRYWPANSILSSLVGQKGRPTNIFRDSLMWPVKNDNGGYSNEPTLDQPILTFNYMFNMFSSDGDSYCHRRVDQTIDILIFLTKILLLPTSEFKINVVQGLTLEAIQNPTSVILRLPSPHKLQSPGTTHDATYTNINVQVWKQEAPPPPESEMEGAVTSPPRSTPGEGGFGGTETEERFQRMIRFGQTGLLIGGVTAAVVSYFFYILFVRMLPFQLELQSAVDMASRRDYLTNTPDWYHRTPSGAESEGIAPLDSFPFTVIICCICICILSIIACVACVYTGSRFIAESK